MRKLCLNLIMVTDDLIMAPFIVPNILHYGPAKSRATHVLDGGVQGPKKMFANVHGVVDLTRKLYRAAPHITHCLFALMPRVL